MELEGGGGGGGGELGVIKNNAQWSFPDKQNGNLNSEANFKKFIGCDYTPSPPHPTTPTRYGPSNRRWTCLTFAVGLLRSWRISSFIFFSSFSLADCIDSKLWNHRITNVFVGFIYNVLKIFEFQFQIILNFSSILLDNFI